MNTKTQRARRVRGIWLAALASLSLAAPWTMGASTYLKTVTSTLTGTPHCVTGTLTTVRGYIETVGVDISPAGQTGRVNVVNSEGVLLFSNLVTAAARWAVRVPIATTAGVSLEPSNQWAHAVSYGNCTAYWVAVSAAAQTGTVRLIYSR